jgi:hypothetical protein
MNPMNYHRLRGNRKAMSAALGVGVLITMGAVTLADPTMEAGTPSDSWKADTAITLTPSLVPPSVAPKIKTSPCDFKPRWPTGWPESPHARLYGCS